MIKKNLGKIALALLCAALIVVLVDRRSDADLTTLLRVWDSLDAGAG